MKLPLLLACLQLSALHPLPLLVLDMDGKKPVQTATSFSMGQYFSRSFPIHAADLAAVTTATEKAARLLDHQPACGHSDTLFANHTRIIVKTSCDDGRSATVRYITQLDELHFICDFELVRGEQDLRRAQIKLLDFAAYLTQ